MKKKVFFILPTLHAGGAERVMSFVAQNLSKEKFNTTLVVIGLEKESKFEITNVPIVFLNKSRVLHGVFAVSKLIAKEKPDIVVSCIGHLNAMMGLISVILPKPLYVGRQAGIWGTPINYNKKRKRKKSLMKYIFDYHSYGTKNLDYYIAQCTDMKDNIIKYSDGDEKYIRVINNPITQPATVDKQKNTSGVKKYITVGRLSEPKGHIRILRMLSKLTFPFEYTIIGQGTFYESIVNEVEALGLTNSVKFVEYTSEIPKYLSQNDMFLQGSFSEGFPNALLESCVVGTPVIAFNVPGGTKDIVEHNVNGFLVENEDEFLKGLNDNREWDPESIKESVYKKFSKDIIIGEYEKFFTEITN